MVEMRSRTPEPSFQKTKQAFTWRVAAYIRYQTMSVNKEAVSHFSWEQIGLILKEASQTLMSKTNHMFSWIRELLGSDETIDLM